MIDYVSGNLLRVALGYQKISRYGQHALYRQRFTDLHVFISL